MNKPSTFSERLDQLLSVFDISRSELARRTNISKSSITHYLRGDWEAKQDKVYAIARAMNISEAWLMGYDVPMERDSNKKASAPESPKTDARLDKIIDQYHSMNADGQIELAKYADYISTKPEYSGKHVLELVSRGDGKTRLIESDITQEELDSGINTDDL